MASFKDKGTSGTIVVGVVSPFKELSWDNAKEAVVVQGGKSMGFPDLMQEIANKRNIPLEKQVWKRGEYLVTVGKDTILPPTLEQIRSGELIRTMLEVKQSETAATERAKDIEKTYKEEIKALEKQLQLVKSQKAIMESNYEFRLLLTEETETAKKAKKTNKLTKQVMRRNRELSQQYLTDDFCLRLNQCLQRAHHGKTLFVQAFSQ